MHLNLRHWSALNAFFLVALWLCHRFIGERSYLTLLLLALPQHVFALPTLLLSVCAARARLWWLFGGNFLVLPIFVFVLLDWHWPKLVAPQNPSAFEPPLRVMTFNIDSSSAAATNAIAAIEREKPDVVCLQEVEAWNKRPEALREIRRRLPGWRMVRHGELAIFTQLPILAHRIWPFPQDMGDGILEATVTWNERRVHFLTLHVGRPIAGAIGWTPPPVGRRAARREMQISALIRAAKNRPEPLVVCGDFNTPPRGLIYQSLTAHFTDVFAKVGLGCGFTYPARLPVLRIDHIFTNRFVSPFWCRVGAATASDHRPVVAELEFHR